MPGASPSLVRRQWLTAFGLWPLNLTANASMTPEQVCKLDTIENNTVGSEIVRRFSKLFSNEPGYFTGGEMKIYVKENVEPRALKARHVPYAIVTKIEKELTRLQDLGHLEKVESSEWAAPIVPVIKSNGDITICGDFKLTINPYLIIDKTMLPKIDDIFRALQRGKKFSQLDLKHAYMQIPVEEKSGVYLTISTHLRLFRYKKMPEGVASKPGDFQNKMEQCWQGIPHVIAYLDNIFVTAKRATNI